MTEVPMILPVILSGGGGTRLWPMSVPDRPKQFLALTGERTMFQLTLDRVTDQARFLPPLIVANAAHTSLVETQMAEAGMAPGAIVLEPCARNTAPAIALAALLAPKPETLLLVMPSDHVITDPAAFAAAIDRAAPLAVQGWLVTFGIAPTGPETGYGYIAAGDTLADGVNRVSRFIEKPDLARAEAMLAAGGHAWNGGIFLFTAGRYLDALETHAPAMLSAARAAVDGANRDDARVHPDAAAFADCPADSIDYAVMERDDRVAVVPVDMGWSDVGSWDALHALGSGEGGNVISGDVLAIDTSGCLIRGEGVKVGVIGVEDLVIVATPERVLVMPRSRAQDVRVFSEKL